MAQKLISHSKMKVVSQPDKNCQSVVPEVGSPRKKKIKNHKIKKQTKKLFLKVFYNISKITFK